METTFTAAVGPVDDDGYQGVRITGPDYDETYVLRSDMTRQWVEQELGILNDPRRDETCEHGLSAALCSGPMHY